MHNINIEIRKKKWKWADHIIRTKDERWTKKIMEWTLLEDKRKRGRQMSRWSDDIAKTAGTDWR